MPFVKGLGLLDQSISKTVALWGVPNMQASVPIKSEWKGQNNSEVAMWSWEARLH